MDNIVLLAILGFILLDFVVVAFVFWQRSRPRISSGELGFVRTQWQLIRAGANPKSDILEADKLLDFVLGKLGYTGSLGEKLKKADKLFGNTNAVWSAHKLRNRLAHELNFEPSPSEVRQALNDFGRALRELGVPLELG